MVQINTPDALIQEAKKYGVNLKTKINFDPKMPLLEVSAQFNGEEYIPEGLEDDDFGGFFNPIGKLLKKHKKKLAEQLASKMTTPEGKAAAMKLASAPLKLNVKETLIGNAKIIGGVAAGVATGNPFIIGAAAASTLGAATGSKLLKTAGSIGNVAASGKVDLASLPNKITSFHIPKNVNPANALASADRFLSSQSTVPAIKQQIVNNTKAMAALGDPNARRGISVLSAAQQIRINTQTPPGKNAVDAKPLPLKAVKREQSKSKVIHLAQKSDAAFSKKGWWIRFKGWLKGHLGA